MPFGLIATLFRIMTWISRLLLLPKDYRALFKTESKQFLPLSILSLLALAEQTSIKLPDDENSFYYLFCSSSLPPASTLSLWQSKRRHVFLHDSCLSDNYSYFATALACEGTTEGETSQSILTWRLAKLSLIDGNLSRLVLGAITKPKPLASTWRVLSTISSLHPLSSNQCRW